METSVLFKPSLFPPHCHKPCARPSVRSNTTSNVSVCTGIFRFNQGCCRIVDSEARDPAAVVRHDLINWQHSKHWIRLAELSRHSVIWRFPGDPLPTLSSSAPILQTAAAHTLMTHIPPAKTSVARPRRVRRCWQSARESTGHQQSSISLEVGLPARNRKHRSTARRMKLRLYKENLFPRDASVLS